MVRDAVEKPRARRRRANLQRIVDTAFDIVAADGLEGLSMARLADACDYTPGALYRYYRSKDAIISALVTRVIEDLGVRAEESREGRALPLDRVFAVAWSYRNFSVEMPHRFGLIATLLASSERMLPQEEDAEPVMQTMIRVLQPLGADITSATAEGALDAGDVLQRTVLLFAALQGVLQLHKQARIAPHLIDIDRMVVAAVRDLLVGWGADPTDTDAAINRVLGTDLDPGEPS